MRGTDEPDIMTDACVRTVFSAQEDRDRAALKALLIGTQVNYVRLAVSRRELAGLPDHKKRDDAP